MGGCGVAMPPWAGLSEPSGIRTVLSLAGFHVSCCNGDVVENGPDGCVWAFGGAGLNDSTDLDP
jgi:hypothetical protein